MNRDLLIDHIKGEISMEEAASLHSDDQADIDRSEIRSGVYELAVYLLTGHDSIGMIVDAFDTIVDLAGVLSNDRDDSISVVGHLIRTAQRAKELEEENEDEHWYWYARRETLETALGKLMLYTSPVTVLEMLETSKTALQRVLTMRGAE